MRSNRARGTIIGCKPLMLPESSAYSLTAAIITLVDVPTPISPIGKGVSATPAYTFSAVAGATGYQLYLYTNATAKGASTRWYSAAEVGAASGTGAIPQAAALPAGAYTWLVRAQNSAGAGAWSANVGFNVGAPPPAPTPISPIGKGVSATPAYTFSAVTGATGYQLYLYTNATAKGASTRWYSAAEVGAASGTGAIPQAAALPAGAYTWLVRAQNSTGAGAWSANVGFNVGTPPPAPTPLSPIGKGVSATPAYTFGAVAGATGYQLYLYTNATAKGASTRWYSAAEVGAASGTGSIPQAGSLPTGLYCWFVRAQNSEGTGAWSALTNFRVTME